MTRRTHLLLTALILVAASACAAAFAQAPDVRPESSLVKQVRHGHPRLMLLDQDLPALRQSIQENPILAGWYQQIHQRAEELLGTPLVSFTRDVRNHILEKARQVVDRVYHLGLVYRVEQDGRFAARAIEEVLQAARLDSWNPDHFLDTAELTHAVAIGYDWLYPALSPGQRTEIVEALCAKGLNEGNRFYDNPWPVLFHPLDFNWAVCNFNWNQVCNGGLTIGALAVAEEAPALADHTLVSALKSIPRAMAEFGPDGGWAEGPRYWEYTTTYTTYFLAALESAIGGDIIAPLLQTPGFDKTGLFRLHMIGPSGKTFNFADSRDTLDRSHQMFWMGKKFRQPVYAWNAERSTRALPFDLLWYDATQQGPKAAGLPLDACFRRVETVFLRGAWEDPNASYVGFKGGNNAVNHGHLDLGSFVLDTHGRRWALDLGPDDYSLPFYFEWGKTTYYRLGTRGHNTLLINGRNQRWDAAAPVVAFHSEPECAFGVVDLSQAYNLPKSRLLRGIALLQRQNVVLQDTLRLETPAEVVWQMHTEAEVELHPRSATLRDGGETLTVQLLEPGNAVLDVASAEAPPPETQQPTIHKLEIRISAPPGESRIVVVCIPGAQTAPLELPAGLGQALAGP